MLEQCQEHSKGKQKMSAVYQDVFHGPQRSVILNLVVFESHFLAPMVKVSYKICRCKVGEDIIMLAQVEIVETIFGDRFVCRNIAFHTSTKCHILLHVVLVL